MPQPCMSPDASVRRTRRSSVPWSRSLFGCFMPSGRIIIPVFMADLAPAPRLVVIDALGRRIVNIDKALFTIGRRSETDLRLPGADISRVHAEISLDNGTCVIRDK